MGTRARIALELNNKGSEPTYISCHQHWDGYPSKLGFQLCTWWRKPEKVRKAIELGNGSSWDFIIGQKANFEDYHNPQHNVQNIYYHRDRGDSWQDVQYQTHPTLEDLISNGFHADEEYLYLMKDGLWYYIDENWDNHMFQPLWDMAIQDYFEHLNQQIKPEYPTTDLLEKKSSLVQIIFAYQEMPWISRLKAKIKDDNNDSVSYF